MENTKVSPPPPNLSSAVPPKVVISDEPVLSSKPIEETSRGDCAAPEPDRDDDHDYFMALGITSAHAGQVLQARYTKFRSQICEQILTNESVETRLGAIRNILLQRHIQFDIGKPGPEMVKMFMGASIVQMARHVQDITMHFKELDTLFDTVATVLRSQETPDKQLMLISNLMI
jgi:hypothetical protein